MQTFPFDIIFKNLKKKILALNTQFGLFLEDLFCQNLHNFPSGGKYIVPPSNNLLDINLAAKL